MRRAMATERSRGNRTSWRWPGISHRRDSGVNSLRLSAAAYWACSVMRRESYKRFDSDTRIMQNQSFKSESVI